MLFDRFGLGFWHLFYFALRLRLALLAVSDHQIRLRVFSIDKLADFIPCVIFLQEIFVLEHLLGDLNGSERCLLCDTSGLLNLLALALGPIRRLTAFTVILDDFWSQFCNLAAGNLGLLCLDNDFLLGHIIRCYVF